MEITPASKSYAASTGAYRVNPLLIKATDTINNAIHGATKSGLLSVSVHLENIFSDQMRCLQTLYTKHGYEVGFDTRMPTMLKFDWSTPALNFLNKKELPPREW